MNGIATGLRFSSVVNYLEVEENIDVGEVY